MDRLELIASLTKGSHSLLDVGCDHAYVLIKALTKYNISFGIASDINEGPLKVARQNVLKNHLEDRVKIVKSDGLKDIEDNFDTVIISGMGGNLIRGILEESKEKIKGKKLILEPNNDQRLVREFLMQQDFLISDEFSIIDMGKYYEIIVAIPGLIKYEDYELKFGPILLKKREKAFLSHYKDKEALLKNVIQKVTNDSILLDKKNELELIQKYIVKKD